MARGISQRDRFEQNILKISLPNRHWIGQELHDSVGSTLTAALLQRRLQAQHLRDGKQVSAEKLDEIAALLLECSRQVRCLSRGMSLIHMHQWGLEGALSELCGSVQRCAEVNCLLDLKEPIEIASEDALQLYRIAQEAVNNALKHARASLIMIRLHRRNDQLILSIEDDGIGYDPAEAGSGGIGLRTMEHRAQLIGACFDIQGVRGKGTTLSCMLPLAGPQVSVQVDLKSRFRLENQRNGHFQWLAPGRHWRTGREGYLGNERSEPENATVDEFITDF